MITKIAIKNKKYRYHFSFSRPKTAGPPRRLYLKGKCFFIIKLIDTLRYIKREKREKNYEKKVKINKIINKKE